ncbi:class A beta-lactamase [Streptomyces hydrogenans]|uniref:class A beta-lactamase n=1 Tax=Streptomyces hydrogenans TaxID=1873719 RepID=UPI0019BAD65E|nr:class A beta-lactamase [Streptomyces hydrogenans]GHG39648.1 beta-lactamase [Streptomyces hydrogenans]
MYSQHPGASRRTALALGAGKALAAALALARAGPAHALTAPAGRDEEAAAAHFRALEERYGARLGVHAHDVRTGRTLAHRDDERFPMCSTFKTLAVAAVLRDLDHDGTFLARRLHYTAAYVARSGWSPVTGSTENIARGMTVAELCDATIRFSDNTAANLLLRELGGPTAITRFARSTGDPVTRLDRWEPRLNSAEPWRITDTTTPRAIARTYGRLVLGRVLEPADRALLTDWLLRNTTSLARFRKGLPADWTVADKTGGGEYGTNNDVGVTWPPDGGPILLSVLTTRPEPEAEGVDELVAAAATVVAEELR